MSPATVSLIALLSGSLLALMVFFNGLLASFIKPFEASLVVHSIGLVAALLLMALLPKKTSRRWPSLTSWGAGIFGGLSVVVVGITVNSKLGVSGTVGLGILGQVIYSWINDWFGLFGSTRRKITLMDFLQALLILAGVGVLIYG